jgi:N-acetyl-alpha-D-glucosaminyl L-malate synthase BshA
MQHIPPPQNVTFHLVEQPDYALFTDIGSPYTIQAASKMIEIVRKYNIDVIHSHYTIPHAVSAYLAKQATGVKIVTTAHGSDTHTLGGSPSYNSTITLALQNSDAVTSVSKFLAAETEELFALGKDSVNVVHNFIEPEEFKPVDGKKQKWVIQASNFRPIKQLPFMIETFAGVVKEHPDWTLQLVGYGPEYPICVRKSRELGIRDKVKFLGVRRDIPDLIAQSSILASTSKTESFGLTIAEGMASATSVFAPRVGGIPEICIDEENGLLYESNNLEDAVSKLSKLMADDESRNTYGLQGRKRIIDKFSPSTIVPQYENIYASLLE